MIDKRFYLIIAFLDLIGVLNEVGHAVTAIADEPLDEEMSQTLTRITSLLGCQREQETQPDKVLPRFKARFFQSSCDLIRIVLPPARTELERIQDTSPDARRALPLLRLLLDDLQEQAYPN